MKCARKKNFGPLSRFVECRASQLYECTYTYIYIYSSSPSFPPCSAFSEILFPRESSTFEDAGRRETKENKERARLGIRHSSRVGGAGGARARPTHGHTYIHRLPSILGEFTKALVARLIVTGLVSISRTYVARVQLDVG